MNHRDCYRLFLKPQQRHQLMCLAGKLKHGKRLMKVLKEADLRVRPKNQMTRIARAEMVVDNLQEQLCELETLQEEMGDWVKGQKETPFSQTAQFHEVTVCEGSLSVVVNSITEAIRRLELCKFPSWGDAANSSKKP